MALGDVEEAWTAHCANPKRSGITFRTAHAATRAVGRHGLGLGARIAILAGLVDMTQDELLACVYPNGLPTTSTKRHLQDAVQLNNTAHIKDYLVEDLFGWFQAAGYSSRTLGEFHFQPFTSPHAVSEFVEWLLDEPPRARTDATLMGASRQTVFHEEDREDNLRKLEAFLSIPDDDDDKDAPKIVQVVVGEGMVEGLRALAGKLMRESVDDDRPYVFLPVGRYPAGVAGHEGANISFASLVGNLEAFCLGESLPAQSPPRSSEEIREAILRIREMLTAKAKVLIFEGAPSSKAVASLNATVIDDGLSELLSEIVHPRWMPEDEMLDPREFYRNRFIVLSEGQVDAVAAFQHDPIALEPPSVNDIGKIIKGQKRLNKDLLPSLMAYPEFRVDGALTVLDDLLSMESEANPAFDIEDPPALWATAPGVVTAWTERLEPLHLLILRFVAISRDGLRIGTLLRLLTDWAVMQRKDDPDGWVIEAPADFKALDKVVGALVSRGLLVIGRDEPIRGLDDQVLAASGLSVGVLVDPKGPRTIDFPSAMLRAQILGHMFRPPDTKAWKDRPAKERRDAIYVVRMHRMIAEAALAQFTIVARHADWTDNYDARHYRRLIQAIFHGFASLALGPEHEDAALRKIHHALPVAPARAYERLYSVYYLGLVEAPPAWELSRVLGREDLKIDVVLSAMNADQRADRPWNRLYGFARRLDGELSEFLRKAPSSESDLGFHQNLALARACYHRADHNRARAAIERCSKALPEAPSAGERDPRLTDRVAVEKVWADVLLAWPDTANAEAQDPQARIRQALTVARFPDPELDVLQKLIASEGRKVEGDLWSLDGPITKQAEAWAETADADELASWADLLCRLAEAGAQDTSGPQVSEWGVLQFAFATMFLAERLRRAAFDKAPLSRKFYVNGHSTRFFVRTALELAQIWERLKPGATPPRGLPTRAYLEDLTRRHIDVVTRYLHKIPTERASLLILEAAFQRRFHGNTKDGVEAALHCLQQADILLANTAHRPRVRLRYSVERLKVLLAAIPLAAKGDDVTRLKARLAFEASYELARLRTLAQKAPPSWMKQATALGDRGQPIWEPLKAHAIGHGFFDAEEPEDLGEDDAAGPAAAQG